MKKILVALTVISMSATAVLAQTTPIVTTDAATEVTQVQRAAVYEKIVCKDLKIDEDGIWNAIDANGNEVRFIIRDNTLKLAADGSVREFADGDEFTAYIAGYEPSPLVLPPLYYPRVIVGAADDALNVNVDVYKASEDGGLVNAGITLEIPADTKAVAEDGKDFDGTLDGRELVVFYGASTKSIPAQTTPEKVIALNEREEDKPATKLELEGLGKSFELKDIDGIKMVAVREVGEALGYTISWDAENKTVTAATKHDSVSFKIGENAYSKNGAEAISLLGAPTKVETEAGGVTYVPVELFTEVFAQAGIKLA